MDTQTILALALLVAVTLLLAMLAWGIVPSSSTKRAARIEREPRRVIVRGPVEYL